jgi:hypothetical protein
MLSSWLTVSFEMVWERRVAVMVCCYSTLRMAIIEVVLACSEEEEACRA